MAVPLVSEIPKRTGPATTGVIRANFIRALAVHVVSTGMFLALGALMSRGLRSSLLEEPILFGGMITTMLVVQVFGGPHAIAWNEESLSVAGWLGNRQTMRWADLESFHFWALPPTAALVFADDPCLRLALAGFSSADRRTFQSLFLECFPDRKAGLWRPGDFRRRFWFWNRN
jgi:hypothetical protein